MTDMHVDTAREVMRRLWAFGFDLDDIWLVGQNMQAITCDDDEQKYALRKLPDTLKGYHPSVVGSSTHIHWGDSLLTCAICLRKVKSLTRYDRDYPEDPDLNICVRCEEDFFKGD